MKVVQQRDLVVIIYEAFGPFRQIYLDGRRAPSSPNPTWLGYSVGRWEGDTLVVETTGFNGKSWLDYSGHPATEALRLTERIRRPDFGHLEIKLTIDDPGAYTRPWSVTLGPHVRSDTDVLEYICNENEKDSQHMKPLK